MNKVAILLLLFFSLTVQAAPRGERLFAIHCAACHGINGAGGVGVPLALPSFINSVSDVYLKKRFAMAGRVVLCPRSNYLAMHN